MTHANDRHITTLIAEHLIMGLVRFDRIRQDRRTYYRLTWIRDGFEHSGGSLTDRAHAEQTIAYWRDKGWIAS